MKPRFPFFIIALATAGSLAAAPAPKTAPKAAAPAPEWKLTPSVFVPPKYPQDGCDPFFPDSNRPYETKTANQTVTISSLELQGLSGAPGHRLAIINGCSFAVGDDEAVDTAQGRVFIRCVAINADSAVVEIGGARHELSFPNNP